MQTQRATYGALTLTAIPFVLLPILAQMVKANPAHVNYWMHQDLESASLLLGFSGYGFFALSLLISVASVVKGIRQHHRLKIYIWFVLIAVTDILLAWVWEPIASWALAGCCDLLS
ncbi:MAG: hypothetical protein AAB691_03035 [Patescibacteria group bacterium]